MAIFVASTKSISRGKGQSAVAAASYRAGVKLEDKRYGKIHDYSKRHGVTSTDIILPSVLTNANAIIKRDDLWNMAEEAEKRKDARVGREWLINLPYELNEIIRKELAHTFAQTLADRYGTIADCAIHKPTKKEIARGADPRNYHAHIMFTTRRAEVNDHGEIKLTDKATIELSDNKRRELGLKRVSKEIKDVRLLWEQIANVKLAEYGHDLIDSRSYKEIGVNITPQIKMGKEATHIERNRKMTIKGDWNRFISERNELVWRTELVNNKKTNDKADQIITRKREVNESGISRRIEWAYKNIGWTANQTKRIDEITETGQQRVKRYEHETGEITYRLSNSIAQQRRTDSIIANSIKPKTQSTYTTRNRVINTERRINDTKREIFGTDRDIERFARKVGLVIHKKAKKIGFRFFRNYYILHYRYLIKINDEDLDKRLNARQEKILNQFSVQHNLIPKTEYDVDNYRKKLIEFFEVSENIKKHQNFIKMLSDPKADQLDYAKTLSEAQQVPSNDLTYEDSRKEHETLTNTSEVAYRPGF